MSRQPRYVNSGKNCISNWIFPSFPKNLISNDLSCSQQYFFTKAVKHSANFFFNYETPKLYTFSSTRAVTATVTVTAVVFLLLPFVFLVVMPLWTPFRAPVVTADSMMSNARVVSCMMNIVHGLFRRFWFLFFLAARKNITT